MPRRTLPGSKHHVAADIAAHLQLHFGVVRLVDRDGERGAAIAAERVGVELGDDRPFLVGLQRGRFDRRGGATATCPHRRDVDVLKIDVLDGKLEDGLRAGGHRAEVVAGGA